MTNKNNFEHGLLFTLADYIWWFLLGNFYFWLMNIPFACIILIMPKGEVNQYWLLLIISSLPIGPALTALFSVMGKLIREHDINITKDFFKAYKVNFFESLFFWILELTVIAMLYIDKIYIVAISNVAILYRLFIALTVMCIAMNFYVFPIISRFYFNKLKVLKLSLHYLIKKAHIAVLAFFIIWVMYKLLPIVSIMVVLLSVSILCYIIMYLQNGTLLELENKLKNYDNTPENK